MEPDRWDFDGPSLRQMPSEAPVLRSPLRWIGKPRLLLKASEYRQSRCFGGIGSHKPTLACLSRGLNSICAAARPDCVGFHAFEYGMGWPPFNAVSVGLFSTDIQTQTPPHTGRIFVQARTLIRAYRDPAPRRLVSNFGVLPQLQQRTTSALTRRSRLRAGAPSRAPQTCDASVTDNAHQGSASTLCVDGISLAFFSVFSNWFRIDRIRSVLSKGVSGST
jgi:hypothetical protein